MIAFTLALAMSSEPPRVEAARKSKMAEVHAMFDAAHVAYPPKQILLRAFKKDAVVELWAGDDSLTLVHEFKICASSGTLGPKVKQGDGQVPEGFYTIDKLNPFSTFHLALHVDYPNKSDRLRNKDVVDLGGDIMVHGNCVTIGCIPLEDDPIELLYLVVVDAGGKAPIHIFPAKDIAKLDVADDATRRLWAQLDKGKRAFDDTHRIPRITIDANGDYVVH
jgi:murein L,D-transpeptidase YafK